MKSVHLQKDKSIFDLTQLPIEAFAASLGLPGAPQIKFIGQAHQKKNAARGKLQQEEQDKAQVNVAGEKETETASAIVGSQVELADSESDESELGSGDENEVDSEDELRAGTVNADVESESESDVNDVHAKDDASTSKKVRLAPLSRLVPKQRKS
jgi:ATP-dependent RNA helicase DDX10/DBP4